MFFPSHSNLLLLKRNFPNLRLPNLLLSSSSYSALPEAHPPPSDPPKPSSLSSRMSFVFDQIDQINKDRSQKDQTLQRIRAWRDSKHQQPNIKVEEKEENGEAGRRKDLSLMSGVEGSDSGLVLTHPWPEWMELMQRLLQQNYFDHKRADEEGLIQEAGFMLGEGEEQGRKMNFVKEFKAVEAALFNFGRDRFDILRQLSRKDLQILVGYGCPRTDRRTTDAAKVLRKYVHLDEGDVCSSCSMRSSCQVAYLMLEKEKEARTFDVMRILLTYGFDPINTYVMNKPLLKLKSVKTVVRKLLHEVVKLSAVPIDPNLSPPVIKMPPPKVKQPPPPPRRRIGRDDVEMKKGDWLCAKCDFLNFAKNTICLQCDAKRPQRQLLPGEWECPQCNFLNYRRNVQCFHCECNRPQDERMESHIQAKQDGFSPRTGKVLSREEVSNAWNFNFDDDESDGADVAAFEYADSNKLNENHQGGFDKSGQTRMYERNNSPVIAVDPRAGFNDFSDDDVDNYELDNRNEAERAPRVDFAELKADSESESENGDSSRHASRISSLNDLKKPARAANPTFTRSKEAELDFGSDDDLPVHPKWKSSHVANPKQSTNQGGALSFGSDDDSISDDEGMGGGFSSSRRVQGRQGGNSNSFSSEFESDDDQDFHRAKGTGAGSRSGASRGGALRGGRGQFSGTDDEGMGGGFSAGRRVQGRQGGNRNRTSSDFESDDDQDFDRAKRTGGRNGSRGGALRGGRGQFSGTDYPNYSRNERDSGKSAFNGQRSNDRRGKSQTFGRANERGRSSFDGQRSNDRRGNSQTFGKANERGRSSFDGQRSNDRSGNSQSFGRAELRSHSQQRGRSAEPDSYYDGERFRRPRNNVR